MKAHRRIKLSIGRSLVITLTTAAVFMCLLSCAFAETNPSVSNSDDTLGELEQPSIPNTLSDPGVIEALTSFNSPSTPQATPVRRPMATASDFDPILDSKWYIFWIEGDVTMEDTITFLSPVDTSGSSPMLAVVSEKWVGGGGTFYNASSGFDAYVQRSNGHWVVYNISFDESGMPKAFGTVIHLDQDFNYVSGYNAFISLLLPIDADFSADVTQGTAPLTVTFASQTKGSAENIEWDFGDGGTSSVSDPVHEYDQAGSYTVVMEVSNAEDWDREQKTGYITVESPFPAPVAAFEAQHTQGNAPFAVSFTNLSTGEITTQHWDFGDGQTNAEETPTHVYMNPGTYSVSLTVEGPGGSHTSTEDNYIVVGEGSKMRCDCNGDGTISLADVGLALKMASSCPNGDTAINLEARIDAGAGLGIAEAICGLRHISGVVNTPPVADAGPDKSHAVGVLAVLDGSDSYDPDGDPLAFTWTMTGKPAGSSASITGSTTETPSFTPDVSGAYVFTLVVSDGTADSPGDAITITASVTSPPLFNDFGFELQQGDFFDYQWDSKRVYWDSFSGSSTTNESGNFRVTLGNEKTINGITAYAVSVGGDAGDYAPRWDYLAIAENRLYGSEDGETLVVLFDAQDGVWPGSGFFTVFDEGILYAGTSGTIENDYVSGPAIVVSQSSSSSQCQYFPNIGTICGGEYNENLDVKEYYKDNIGPFGYYKYTSMSDMTGQYPWSSNTTIHLGLIATSLRGDTTDYEYESEPNDSPSTAAPLAWPMTLNGFCDAADNGFTVERMEDELNQYPASAQKIQHPVVIHGNAKRYPFDPGVTVTYTWSPETLENTFVDWYAFSIQDTTPYKVTLDYSQQPDSQLWIHLFNDTGTLSLGEMVDMNLDENDTLKVLPIMFPNKNLTPGNYVLGILVQHTHNNRTSYDLKFAKGADLDIEDWYTFSLSSQRSVQIQLNPASGQADVDLYLFDAWMYPIQASSLGAGDTEVLNVPLDAGSYYIGVDAATGKSGYELIIE